MSITTKYNFVTTSHSSSYNPVKVKKFGLINLSIIDFPNRIQLRLDRATHR